MKLGYRARRKGVVGGVEVQPVRLGQRDGDRSVRGNAPPDFFEEGAERRIEFVQGSAALRFPDREAREPGQLQGPAFQLPPTKTRRVGKKEKSQAQGDEDLSDPHVGGIVAPFAKIAREALLG